MEELHRCQEQPFRQFRQLGQNVHYDDHKAYRKLNWRKKSFAFQLKDWTTVVIAQE
jgi:hypothetical protein